MKNKTDFIFGLALVVFCVVMGSQIYILPPSNSNELFTAASFPTGILGALFVLSIILIIVSLRQQENQSAWPEAPVMKRIILISLAIIIYVSMFIWIGNIGYDALWPAGSGFAISTFLFLICAQYISNRRVFIQNTLVSAIMTLVCYVIFVFFFKVPLI